MLLRLREQGAGPGLFLSAHTHGQTCTQHTLRSSMASQRKLCLPGGREIKWRVSSSLERSKSCSTVKNGGADVPLIRFVPENITLTSPPLLHRCVLSGWECESSRGKMALLILMRWVIKHHAGLGLCLAQTM